MGKKRIVVLATAIAAVFLCLIPFAFAEDKEVTRLTLRGVKEVYVVIESIEPEIEDLGLTQAQVRADVEAKLRGANIAVAPDFRRGPAPAVHLYVQVIRPERTNRLFYSISLSLLQNVVLERDPNAQDQHGYLVGASARHDFRHRGYPFRYSVPFSTSLSRTTAKPIKSRRIAHSNLGLIRQHVEESAIGMD